MTETETETLTGRVATIALTLPKTKKRAWESLTALIEALDAGNYPVDDLVPHLAQLYAHHMPEPPAKPKTAWDWVARAANPKNVRPYCQAVFVKDGLAYATDGRRIHAAPTDLPDGAYNAAGDQVSVDVDLDRLPHTRIIPDPRRLTPAIAIHGGVYEDESAPVPYCTLKAAAIPSRQVHVQKTYLDAALALNDNVLYSIPSDETDRSTPVRLDFADGRLALIAPYRV